MATPLTSIIVLRGATIPRENVTDIGMDFYTGIDKPLSWDEWLDVRADLERAETAIQWWYVDWIAYGREHFPDSFTQVLPQPDEVAEKSYKTLMNWLNVGSKFPIQKRYPKPVTFTHHAAVCGIDDEKVRDTILKEVVKSELSVDETKTLVRDWKMQKARIGELTDIANAPPADEATEESAPIPSISIAKTIPALVTVAEEFSIPEQLMLVTRLVESLRSFGITSLGVIGVPEDVGEALPPPPPSSDRYGRSAYVLDHAADDLPADFPDSYRLALRRGAAWLQARAEGNHAS